MVMFRFDPLELYLASGLYKARDEAGVSHRGEGSINGGRVDFGVSATRQFFDCLRCRMAAELLQAREDQDALRRHTLTTRT
jgi:hypothetical protein